MHLKLIYFPILLASLLPITFLITMSLGIYLKHITSLIPYISDSGVYPPESCIFSQMVNIHSVLMASTIYIRYRQVRCVFEKHNFKQVKFNKISAYIGYLAAFGGSLVANFDELVSLNMHILGAHMVFGLGSIYFCTQTRIYFVLQKVSGYSTINICRAVLSAAILITYTIFGVTLHISVNQFTGTDPTKWKAEEGGLLIHSVSSVSELICSSLSMVYIMLFIPDFKKVTIYEPEIFVEDNFTEPIQLYNRRDKRQETY